MNKWHHQFLLVPTTVPFCWNGCGKMMAWCTDQGKCVSQMFSLKQAEYLWKIFAGKDKEPQCGVEKKGAVGGKTRASIWAFGWWKALWSCVKICSSNNMFPLTRGTRPIYEYNQVLTLPLSRHRVLSYYTQLKFQWWFLLFTVGHYNRNNVDNVVQAAGGGGTKCMMVCRLLDTIKYIATELAKVKINQRMSKMIRTRNIKQTEALTKQKK